jgi:hypothetical protein
MSTQQNDLNIGIVGAGRAIPSDVCDQLKCVGGAEVQLRLRLVAPLSLQTEHLITGDRCKPTGAVGGEGRDLLC